MATKAATSPKSADLTAAEEAWSGPKLIVVGAITLAVALFVLYSISPYKGLVLP